MLPHVNNRGLFEKYYEETMKVMLKEFISGEATETLESIKDSLNAFTEDLKRIYKLDDDDHFYNVKKRIYLKKSIDKVIRIIFTLV
jgi:hypothetical protein